MTLPEHALRLFAHFEEPSELAPDDGTVIERLLEDGDGRDLRWLTSQVDEGRLTDWLSKRGGRRLSNRSRAFWGVVLDRPAPARRTVGGELWPL